MMPSEAESSQGVIKVQNINTVQPLVGRVEWDFSGTYWLATFEGTFEIPQSVFDEASALLKQQGESDFEVSGRLARGVIINSRVTDLTYLVRERIIPQR